MEKKTLLKQVLAIIAMTLIITTTNIGEVKGALQANKRTKSIKTDTPINWMTNIRNMEKSGETMGLNETLKEDLTATSESNKIDVHMMRRTEYGAIAILSASKYGNKSNEQYITSTTGNNTGIILDLSMFEWIAGGLEENIFSGTNARYYDTYTTSQDSARVGDALGNATTTNPGCTKWHQEYKGSGVNWVNSTSPYFSRAAVGIFSFGIGTDTRAGWCRGVAVYGAEL